MPRFLAKLVEVEAMQWTGDNTRDVSLWHTPDLSPHVLPSGWWLRRSGATGVFELVIETTEGPLVAAIGDWIIRAPTGEVYPCKAHIFNITYEHSRF